MNLDNKTKRLISVTTLGLTLAFLAIACEQGTERGAQPSQAALRFPEPMKIPLANLNDAPLIVVGVAGESRSSWSDEEDNVVTDTTFYVEQVQRGHAPPVIDIHTQGGETDAMISISMHEASFKPGERSRLFLTQNPSGSWRVMGGFAGKQLPLNDARGSAAGGANAGQAGAAASNGVAVVSEAETCVGSSYCFIDGKPRYPWNWMPMPFWVNPQIDATHVTGTSAQVLATIKQGFQTWEDDTSSAVEWAFQGTTTGTSSPAGSWFVTFRPLVDATGSTDIRLDKSTSPPTVIRSTLSLNSALCWRVDGLFGGNCTVSSDPVVYDLQHVVTHESGHILGLSHIPNTNTFTTQPVPNTSNVMYYQYTNGQRTLGPDDRTAIAALYPIGLSPWETVATFNGASGFDVASAYYGHTLLVSSEAVPSQPSASFMYAAHTPGFAWSVPQPLGIAATSRPAIADLLFVPFEYSLVAERAADASTVVIADLSFTGPVPTSFGGLTNYPPAMAVTGNTVNLFVVGLDNALWWRNTSSTSTWTRLNTQVLTSGPKAVVLDANNVLLAARGPSNELLTMWFTSVGLSGWTSRGGPIVGAPTGAARGTTGVDVFARTPNGQLSTASYRGPNGWSSLQVLDPSDTTVLTGDPAAVSWNPKRIDVYAPTGSGTAGHIVHRRFTQ